MAGIYIHVPFCKDKCTYCDFASFPREIGKAEAYFACLYKEIKSRAQSLKDKTFDTIYFGGGTPSYVDPKFILGAMRLIKEQLNLANDLEVTLEVNPGTIDKGKLLIYKKAGINRFSVGLQSADDKILRDINRIHNVTDFLRTMKLLKGFNLSVDIMLGLPNQTLESVKQTIALATSQDIKHISVYALTPEEGTPMYSRYLNGDLPDADTVTDYYEEVVKILKELGFNRYEVSNFAKPGFESRHNLNYWKRGEYIGFGVAASSFINERRFTNAQRIDEYVHCLLHGKYAEILSEDIPEDERRFEYIMLHLRTSLGVWFEDYKKTFGTDFMLDFKDKIPPVNKYLEFTESGVKIKDEYLYVQNNIIIQFMD